MQCSIRSLGFNFTDWFAPFFSVHILTRKVASAEPLYYVIALTFLFLAVSKIDSCRAGFMLMLDFQKKKKHKSSFIWTCFCLGLLEEVSHTIHSAQSEESEIANKKTEL